MASVQNALVNRFVVAGRAARFAVHQTVDAEADVELRLAERTEFIAPAANFGLLALRTDHPACTWFCGHVVSLVQLVGAENVTEVTNKVRSQIAEVKSSPLSSSSWRMSLLLQSDF